MGRLEVVVEGPEVHCQVAALAGVDLAVVCVRARGDGNCIVVDRVAGKPFVRGGAFRIVRATAQTAVGDVNERIRDLNQKLLGTGATAAVPAGTPQAGFFKR